MRVGVPEGNQEPRISGRPDPGDRRRAGRLRATKCFVETKAGMGIDFSDKAYEKVGANDPADRRRRVRGEPT